jgi:hypothetical protein
LIDRYIEIEIEREKETRKQRREKEVGITRKGEDK